MTDHEINVCAEEMISVWLDYNNLWARENDPDAPATFTREYVLKVQPTYCVNLEQLIVHCHCWLDDELNFVQLLGVFDVEDAPPEMRYVSAEVDTSWRDFWAKDGPNGKFLNVPA